VLDILLIAAALLPWQASSEPLAAAQEALQRASTALSHSANQSCDVQKARAAIKTASKSLASAAQYASSHPDAEKLPPLPPDVTPEFTPPPRPAPQRNAMLEGALKNVETTFRRVSETPGADLGGFRDAVYHDLDEAARDLMTAIKAANAAFTSGRRELPDCDARRDRTRS